MKLSGWLMPILIGSVLLGGIGITVSQWISPPNQTTGELVVPALSALARNGQAAYDISCSQCHGRNAAGTKKGPPLVHDIYNPGHHADAAFFRAARQGVQQHHWPFGDMPPRPEVSDKQIAAIVRYIRELQQANGIFYRQHNM